MLSFRFVPVEFASMSFVLSLQTRPSVMACWSPRFAASLNDWSPRPPTSSARPTLKSEGHAGAPALPPVPAPELLLLLQAAAAIARTAMNAADLHVRDRMLPPSSPGRP